MSADAARTLLGVTTLWFVAPLIAGRARPPFVAVSYLGACWQRLLELPGGDGPERQFRW